jgi:hypothetical protein
LRTALNYADLDDEEDKEDGEFSDSDDDESPKRKKAKGERKKHKNAKPSQSLDFSQLPVIDNNGLSYLPKMHYFPVELECPLKPANQLKPEEAVTVIIQLPNGGFKCVALPLDALDEDPNEYVSKRSING